MVAVEVAEEGESEVPTEMTLSSYSFLEEMEALESEYDRDLAAS